MRAGLVCGKMPTLIGSDGRVVDGHVQDRFQVGILRVFQTEFGRRQAGVKDSLGMILAALFRDDQWLKQADGGLKVVPFEVLVGEHEAGPVRVRVFICVDDAAQSHRDFGLPVQFQEAFHLLGQRAVAEILIGKVL